MYKFLKTYSLLMVNLFALAMTSWAMTFHYFNSERSTFGMWVFIVTMWIGITLKEALKLCR